MDSPRWLRKRLVRLSTAGYKSVGESKEASSVRTVCSLQGSTTCAVNRYLEPDLVTLPVNSARKFSRWQISRPRLASKGTVPVRPNRCSASASCERGTRCTYLDCSSDCRTASV